MDKLTEFLESIPDYAAMVNNVDTAKIKALSEFGILDINFNAPLEEVEAALEKFDRINSRDNFFIKTHSDNFS